MKKNPLHKIRTVITVVLATVAFVVAVIGVLATVPKNGNFKMLVVQTGSMEPKIPVGSLLVSRKAASYQVGDVVTYAMKNNFVTHRIVAEEDGKFITQGDANNAPDSQPVNQSSIVGKLWVSLPFVGRFIAFVKTPLGFSLIIVLPSLLIVINEILAIGKELSKTEQRKKAKTKKVITFRRAASVDGVRKLPSRTRTAKSAGVVMIWTRSGKKESQEKIATKKRISQAVAMLLITMVSLIGGTKAYFSDLGLSSNNDFNVGQFIANGLVINEVIYNSSCSNGQVVEIWNGSGSTFDLTGWKLRDLTTTYTISSGATILGPNQFALISQSNSIFSCYGASPAGVINPNLGGAGLNFNTVSGFIELVSPNNSNPPNPSPNTVVDKIWYGAGNPAAAQNKSIERKRLGFDTATGSNFNASDFISQFPATLGFALPLTQPVVINEFRIAPNNQEFIEIFNNSFSNVNIGNWTISRANGTVITTITAGTILIARHTITYTGNTWNNSGERIYLKNNSGVLQDAFSYFNFAPASGSSWARIPDGVKNWQLDATPTPNSANVL